MRPSVVLEKGSGKLSLRVPRGLRVRNPVFFDDLSAVTDVDVSVGEDSSITIVTLLRAGVRQKALNQRARVAERGSIHWFNVTLGADIEQSLTTELAGERARSTIDWMFFASGREKQKLTACNIFLARNGGGEITMKGIAQDKAQVKCNGMIRIGPKGSGTNTHVTEDVLMLDKTAKVDAVPGLEIKTNDVKASHSAAVSRVTAEDLFYFAARGIDRLQARRMYIDGFLGAVAARISDEPARAAVMTALTRKSGSANIHPIV